MPLQINYKLTLQWTSSMWKTCKNRKGFIWWLGVTLIAERGNNVFTVQRMEAKEKEKRFPRLSCDHKYKLPSVHTNFSSIHRHNFHCFLTVDYIRNNTWKENSLNIPLGVLVHHKDMLLFVIATSSLQSMVNWKRELTVFAYFLKYPNM